MVKTARDILIEGLKAMGADGLCNPEECGCGLDDLCPCCGDPLGCVPAKKRPATEEEKDEWEFDEWYDPMEGS